MSSERDTEINREPHFYEAEFELKNENGDDFVDGSPFTGFSYGGNTDKKTGRALPYFTKKIADQLIEALSTLGWTIRFNEKMDWYICRHKDRLRRYYLPGEVITVEDPEDSNRYTIRAYPIGKGLINWEEVVKSWNYVTRAICPYCGTEFGEVNNTCENCGREVNF